VNTVLHRREAPPPAELSAEQDIANALGEDIIFGRLAPGTRLIEDALMARFGATRHFIRAALLQLERTGIVVREKNKGVTVRSLTPVQVRQIYDVREMLQRQAALLIPLPAPQALIDELEAIHARYRQAVRARDFGAVHALNDSFHIRFFGACGNPYLVESIQHYMALSLPVRAKKTADLERLKVSERDHKLMIDLLRGSDRWALAQLCTDHLQPAKDDYLSHAAVAAASAPA
jgi:DNA-binding GntR family transcriptional regulator